LTTYISQGSVATDLRGGGDFNCIFLCRSFLNVIVKKNLKNLSTFVEVIARQSWPGTYDTPCNRYMLYIILYLQCSKHTRLRPSARDGTGSEPLTRIRPRCFDPVTWPGHWVNANCTAR